MHSRSHCKNACTVPINPLTHKACSSHCMSPLQPILSLQTLCKYEKNQLFWNPIKLVQVLPSLTTPLTLTKNSFNHFEAAQPPESRCCQPMKPDNIALGEQLWAELDKHTQLDQKKRSDLPRLLPYATRLNAISSFCCPWIHTTFLSLKSSLMLCSGQRIILKLFY